MVNIVKQTQITFDGGSIRTLSAIAEICRIKLAEDREHLKHISGTERGGEIDMVLQLIFDL